MVWMAYEALGEHRSACGCFSKLLDYGEKHIYDVAQNDFFAVSLPDFLIFDDDMDAKNKAHCYYLMGLAHIGFGDTKEAGTAFKNCLKYDYNHQKCRMYMENFRIK